MKVAQSNTAIEQMKNSPPFRLFCIPKELIQVFFLIGIIIFGPSVLANERSGPETLTLISATTPQPSQEPFVKLGQKIFFDARLSFDQTISCASCHQPEHAFTDGKAVSEGIHGQRGTRNALSLPNAAFTDTKFWDGRKASLLEQVLGPLIDPREHGLKNHAQLLQKFQSIGDYSPLFEKAFGRKLGQATAQDVAQALTAYIMSLKPTTTRLAQYLVNNDKNSLTESERQGLELFQAKRNVPIAIRWKNR